MFWLFWVPALTMRLFRMRCTAAKCAAANLYRCYPVSPSNLKFRDRGELLFAAAGAGSRFLSLMVVADGGGGASMWVHPFLPPHLAPWLQVAAHAPVISPRCLPILGWQPASWCSSGMQSNGPTPYHCCETSEARRSRQNNCVLADCPEHFCPAVFVRRGGGA